MNRRQFGSRIGAALAGWRAAAQSTGDAAAPVCYYVDGYHGGSRGHMPAGSWRDILNAMRTRPDWKVSLDIEPASWDDLRREDPEAYHEWQKLIQDHAVDARTISDIFVNRFREWIGFLEHHADAGTQ